MRAIAADAVVTTGSYEQAQELIEKHLIDALKLRADSDSVHANLVLGLVKQHMAWSLLAEVYAEKGALVMLPAGAVPEAPAAPTRNLLPIIIVVAAGIAAGIAVVAALRG